MNVPINSDLSENVAYDNPLFPAYIRKGLLSAYPDYSAVSHWHDDIELIVFLDGFMDYNVNGKRILLKEADGILVNTRQLHFGFSETKQECEFLCLLLHPELLRANDWFYSRYVLPFFTQACPPCLALSSSVDWQKDILRLASDIFYRKEKETSPCLTQYRFLQIFELLFEHISGVAAPADSAHLECVRKMVDFIRKNYSAPITLTQIARAGECCKSKCSALFQQYLSQSPNHYLIACRLQKSVALLKETNLTVTEIAYRAGFCSGSYYCETFRKHYGISPRQYREKISGTS